MEIGMSDIKISIIVPVYNVGQYLKKCIDSVVTQSFKDIEIICVDDGSSDNSAEILQAYAHSDNRITIITQPNMGVAAARNTGLCAASGEYIMFLDGDDYYMPDACLKAYGEITEKNGDIGIFGNYNTCGNELRQGWTSFKLQEFSDKTEKNDYLEFQVYVWDKIYRKAFLMENNISFVEGLKTAEDVLFCLSCYFKHPKYALINEPLYVYREGRCNSATNDFDCIGNDLAALKELHKMPLFKAQSKEFKLNIVDNFCDAAGNYLKKFSKSKCKKNIYKDSEILVDFLRKNYSPVDLKKIKSYRKLCHYRRDVFFRKVFSVTNSEDKMFKKISLFGLNLKVRRRA